MTDFLRRRGCRVVKNISDFFKTVQDTFLSGRMDSLVEHFATPLVVYSSAGVAVFRTREEIVRRMTIYRDALRRLGVVSGSFEVVSEDPMLGHRFRVTLLPIYYGPDGEEVTRGLVRHYLVHKDETLIVEMLEYLESPLPSKEVRRIIH